MSDFINTIDLLGDDVVFQKIVDRTITEFNDDSIKKVGTYAFNRCALLKTTILPSVSIVDASAFGQAGVEFVDFSARVTFSGRQSFFYCRNLVFVILRSTTMCNLGYIDVFEMSSIANGTGYIYVPRALLSDDDSTKDYRRATNWSNYATQFRALEDYTVDGTITGELDESKI